MGYIFVAGYVLVVGIATFLMKVGLKTLSPYQLNFLMGIGMLITGIPALLIAQHNFKIPKTELPLGFLIGIMMATGSILYVLAFSKLPVGVAAVLATTYVLVAIILSVIFLKESLGLIKIIGIVFTLLGVSLLVIKT